jgi:hypothetical protein
MDMWIGSGQGNLTPYLEWNTDFEDVYRHTCDAFMYRTSIWANPRIAFYKDFVLVDDKGFHPHCPLQKTSRIEYTALRPTIPGDTLEGKLVGYREWRIKLSFTSETCHIEWTHVKCWQTDYYTEEVPGPLPGLERTLYHYTGMADPEVDHWFEDWTVVRDSDGHVVGLKHYYSDDDTTVIYDDRDRDPFWAYAVNPTGDSIQHDFNLYAMPWIKKQVLSRLRDLEETVPRDTMPMDLKTDILSQAVDDAKVLTINSIAFLRDLYHIKELIVPILRLKKKPLDIKSWANLWLTYDYGIRLLIQDIHEVVTNLPKSDVKFALTHVRATKHRTLRGGMQSYDVEYHAKLLLDPQIGIINSTLDMLRRLDLILTRENLWDFVPYSFVVDWFFPIGEKLAQLDLQSDLVLFGAKTAILSSKARSDSLTFISRMPGDGDQYNWANCSIDVSVYWRWHDKPSVSVLDTEFSNGLNLHRGANGMALLIQKIKP